MTAARYVRPVAGTTYRLIRDGEIILDLGPIYFVEKDVDYEITTVRGSDGLTYNIPRDDLEFYSIVSTDV